MSYDASEPPSIKVGVSSCLLGQHVRFDGGHKRDTFINRVLSQYFVLVPVCPEVAIGLGVPREPIRLEKREEGIRVVGVRQRDLDVTEPLREYAHRVVKANAGFSGYIFKSKSPTCGMERVKVYSKGTDMPASNGVGEFSREVMALWPDLPVEEEGRLNDPVLRENFIERVFTYNRWQTLLDSGLTAAGIVDFHTRHKLLIMSHDQEAYRELGREVAACGNEDPKRFGQRYIRALMAVLRKRASRKNQANVLKHVQGFLKDRIDSEDKQELNEVIERYRTGQVPLVVPITLLNHHFRRHPNDYMQRQWYLNPHPPEMMLRNMI